MTDLASAVVTTTASFSPLGGAGHLYLVGLPGSGKTTLGRRLALHYGRSFLDLDAVIVAEAGQDIPAIFEAEGEAGFRRREAAALREVAARPEPLIVATGGGTPCFHDNMGVLLATGFVLWLDVPLSTLVRRLAAGAQAGSRPLVAAAHSSTAPETLENSLKRWLGQTLAARRRFYAQARLRCRGADSNRPATVIAALAEAGFQH